MKTKLILKTIVFFMGLVPLISQQGYPETETPGKSKGIKSELVLKQTERGVMPVLDQDYNSQPVPFPYVKLEDHFWLPRQQVNRTHSIPYAFEQCEKTGRLDNFRLAADQLHHTQTAPKGYKFTVPVFNDTDIYKGIEAASFDMASNPNPEMDAYVDRLIEVIGKAQEEDGYLYSALTCGQEYKERHTWINEGRWHHLQMSHELYCAGHLFEAASAHYISTGKRNFLDIAIRVADLLVKTFGPEKNQLQDVPGHEVVELGLVKLYRVTGKKEYLNLAKFFVDIRGRSDLRRGLDRNPKQMYGEYAQDHLPLVEQKEAVGHAVRATYFYAGAADIAAITRDANTIAAIKRIWNNVVEKKISIHGGLGSSPNGEAFSKNYVLPNKAGQTYNETCAQIGGCYWHHRMFLLDPDAKYYDVFERTIYNSLISGVSLSGDLFFYPNPLQTSGGYQRAPWFGCACCPQNLMRFIASLSGYIYTIQDKTLYVGLYIANRGTISIAGQKLQIRMTGNYPWDGKIQLNIETLENIDTKTKDSPWTLALRIPSWSRNEPVPSDLYRYLDENKNVPVIKVNGDIVPLKLEKGFLKIGRVWKEKDVITIDLPMPVRKVVAHKNVVADRGKIALERGPIVYCFEGVDNQNQILNALIRPTTEVTPQYDSSLLGGVTVLVTKGEIRQEISDAKIEDAKIEDESFRQSSSWKKVPLKAVPYAVWANRSDGPMQIWMPFEESAVSPTTIASLSKVSANVGANMEAVADSHIPDNSNDHSAPYWHTWPQFDAPFWIQYDFPKPMTVSKVGVFWLDETRTHQHCKVPESWKILAKVKGKWTEVENPSEYGVQMDKMNQTQFTPVRAEGLRLEGKPQKKWCAGIHEWTVE